MKKYITFQISDELSLERFIIKEKQTTARIGR